MDIDKTPYETFQGNIIQKKDHEYHEARRIWNGMIDNHPEIIFQCKNYKDVIQAVRYANQKNLQISVRAGGHGVAGNAIVSDGLVIDLRLMKNISLESNKKIVKAEAGLLGADLDRKTQDVGLAVPIGTVSHTGIAGLTLGGGYGWLSRKFGLACDNLLSVDLVTPKGEFLQVNDTQHPDLFWALKGGGGNFGIATSFEYILHPVGPQIFGGLLLYRFEKAQEILKLYRELTQNSSNDFAAYIYFFHEDEELVCCLAFFYLGSIAEGEHLVAPFKRIGPFHDTVGMIPYTTMQTVVDHHAPHGRNYYWRANFLGLEGLSSEAVEIMLENIRNITSKKSLVSIELVGGHVNQIPKDKTAFFHRDVQYNFLICSAWDEKESHQRHIQYANEFWASMVPYFLPGTYQNYDGETSVNPQTIYGDNFQRLQEIKQKYDPEYRLVGNYAFISPSKYD